MRHLLTESQSMVIHQYHFSVAPGDAVTNQMFFIQRSLREIGMDSRLFADHIRGGLAQYVERLNESALWNCDLLLLHHSHGNPQLPKILGVEVPKALIYHNITPEHFFRHDPHMWNLCRIGRRQLRLIRDNTVTAFAVSEYNANELKEMGFKNVFLFPLLDFQSLIPNETAPPPSRDQKHRLLFVGKITAHKNQAALVRMLSYLPNDYELILVGSADPIYLDYLKLLIRGLSLSMRVQIAGKVPNRELRRIYRQADAFVSLSQHEGFGVPLIEAMAYQLPVFALERGAVPETLGPSGVLLKTDAPWEVAQIIRSFFDKPQALKKVTQSQVARVQALKSVQSREKIQQISRDLVHHLRVVPDCEWKKESSSLAKRLDT